MYRSTVAQQDEPTFILYLAFISVNEEQGSEHLKNEMSVCSSALESIDPIFALKAYPLKSSKETSRRTFLRPAAARAVQ